MYDHQKYKASYEADLGPCVYAIILQDGHIKVGSTRRFKYRLANLRQGFYVPITTVHKWPYQSPEEAYEVEKTIHNILKPYRVMGEWYKGQQVLPCVQQIMNL